MQGYHRPVLLGEVIEALKVSCDFWYLDATLGDGGHSLAMLQMGAGIVGLDVDPEAIERARLRFERLGISEDLYKLILGNFRNLDVLISQTELKDQKFKGILFDLGVSSLQLEAPQRGFSFLRDAPLDMRMDPSLGVRALDLINALNKGELNELFYKLGEEKNSRSLAEALVRARALKKVTTTRELALLVERLLGNRGKIHPATKIFQALRIAVNDELGAIQEALPKALEKVEKNGRILVISFHSLEDRIAKNTFKEWQSQGLGEIITKKPICPSLEEIKDNPRSRSAKLRVFEKK